MNKLEIPHHHEQKELPDKSRFLTDQEYRLIQNNIVIGCTDVLIVDKETGETLSGYRKQKPQEGYWFSCGGRMKRGESYQEAGASKIKEELGIDVDPARLELLTAYSTAFNERAQEPSDEGVHTSNAVVVLFVSPEERKKMQLNLNKEHEKTTWVPLSEIEEKDETFPAVLQDAVKKVEDDIYYDFAKQAASEVFASAPKSLEFTNESVGFTEKEFIVPDGHIFFDINTRGMDYNKDPFLTTITSYRSGTKVERSGPYKYSYQKREGVLLALGETKEILIYLMGIPVKALIRNDNGHSFRLRAPELPKELVNKALEIEEHFTNLLLPPSNSQTFERFRLTQEIKRYMESNSGATNERKFIPNDYIISEEGRRISFPTNIEG